MPARFFSVAESDNLFSESKSNVIFDFLPWIRTLYTEFAKTAITEDFSEC